MLTISRCKDILSGAEGKEIQLDDDQIEHIRDSLYLAAELFIDEYLRGGNDGQ